MSLKTDYKDDILAVGNLRKYQMIQNNDGTVSFQDVTQYEQTGDVFGAGDINRTNQAVNEKFDSGDVVDPMLTTEPGFAADAYQTKLQFDEQNKNFTWKQLATVSGNETVTINDLTSYNEVKFVVFLQLSEAQLTYESTLPSYMLNDARKLKFGHYLNASDCSSIQINTTKTTVSFVSAYFGATSYLSNSAVHVIGR